MIGGSVVAFTCVCYACASVRVCAAVREGGGGGGGVRKQLTRTPPVRWVLGACCFACSEPGALLVEHPALTGPGRGLHLFSGGTRQSLSTVCINRPVPATVGSVWEMPDPLGDNPLFIGGVDETTSLFVLHPYGDLPGSTPFLDNLFIGCNINEAAEKVGEGEVCVLWGSEFDSGLCFWRIRFTSPSHPCPAVVCFQAERQDFKFVAGCNKYASASDIPPHYFLASGPGVPLVALLPSLNASHDDGSEGAFGAMLHSAATWSHVMRGFGGEHEVFADVSWHIMASFNLSIGKVVEVDDAHAEDPCAPASVHMAEEEAEGADSDDSDSSDSDSSSSDSSDSESSDSESSDSDSDAGSR